MRIINKSPVKLLLFLSVYIVYIVCSVLGE